MKNKSALFATFGAFGVLSSCGGAGTLPSYFTGPDVNAIAQSQTLGDKRIALPDGQTYASLLATSGNGKIVIEGVGAYQPDTKPKGAPEHGEYVYGTRDLTTDALILTDTKFVLLDSDGRTAPGATTFYYGADPASGGKYIGVLVPPNFDQAGYDSVRIGEAKLADDVKFNLVFGVSTAPGDVPGPAAGTVNYSGHSLILLSGLAAGATVVIGGSGSATADFASGLVDLEAEQSSVAGFSRVEASDLVIDGNTFMGGNVIVRDSGGNDITTTYLGTIGANEAAGMFYGPGADELGAYMLLEGSDKSINVFMVGD